MRLARLLRSGSTNVLRRTSATRLTHAPRLRVRCQPCQLSGGPRSAAGATPSPLSCSRRLRRAALMDQTADSAIKRKLSLYSAVERPAKLMKSEAEFWASNGAYDAALPSNKAPASSAASDSNSAAEDTPAPPIAGALHDTAEWQRTIKKVVKSVVSINFCLTNSFDTDEAFTSEATGFVVDAEKGYILTNRHVVGAGPFTGYCLFDNHEECDVYPVYRDPVHDFGILRFDPKAIKYLTLTPLELRPEFARIGEEIRVVGNDAGEKLSILSGVISRLDRNAPDYGEGYCDFNTNYIQAAAAASGGSSGSPVVNVDGFAVALQAGGRADGAATDYFLPLDRPLRALDCIRNDQHVSRGTVQVQWLLKPFDECRRLGLSPDWEKAIRQQFPNANALLVAEVILPDGPASSKIEEGDVLIKVNGKLITEFVPLDKILDDSVGRAISLTMQRAGDNINLELDVQDLHTITPDRFVTVAGGTFHDLSYQQARLYSISLKEAGVYVAESAGSFRFTDGFSSGWLVHSVDNQSVSNLDDFVRVMKSVPDRKRIVVTHKHIRDLHTSNTSIVYIDRHWQPKMKLAKRNDVTGLWDFSTLADPVPPVPPVRQRANFVELEVKRFPAIRDIVRSFVRVHVRMPVKIDGYPRATKQGFGVVLDAEQGLVLISRAFVPYELCDISVVIADSIFVDAKVVFLHPLQNFVIVKYDTSLVDAPVRTPKLSTEFVAKGDETIFFGFNTNWRPIMANTVVTDITTVSIPASTYCPRYRATNIDAITVETSQAGQSPCGVLLAEDGTVQALFLTYMGERSEHSNNDVEYRLALATPMILPVLKEIQSGNIPNLRILNVEFQTIQLSQARIMGVSEEWIEKTEKADPERHMLFMVRKIDCGHENGLSEGDVLLTLNGKMITRAPDLDVMYHNDSLDGIVLRERQELHLTIPTVSTADLETDRIVFFSGAVLQRPHHAVRQQISKVHSEVYISSRAHGSPAYMYGLTPTNFITHINGVRTPDLSAFLLQVQSIPDNDYFRIKIMSWDNIPWVATMKKNEHYFPTLEYVKDPATQLGWRKILHECDAGGAKEVAAAEAMDVGRDGGTEPVASALGLDEEVEE